MARDYTYNAKGKKEISILSHTGNKHRVSMCLSVISDGEVLTPLIVFLQKYVGKLLETKDYFPKKYDHFKLRIPTSDGAFQ